MESYTQNQSEMSCSGIESTRDMFLQNFITFRWVCEGKWLRGVALVAPIVVPCRTCRPIQLLARRLISPRIWPKSKIKNGKPLTKEDSPKVCYFVYGFLGSIGTKFLFKKVLFRPLSGPMPEIELKIGGTGSVPEKSHRNSSDPRWYRGVVSLERVSLAD